ncbi:hypothetical protein BH09SUM1_BH09SUM1_18110 [soil metagenome]
MKKTIVIIVVLLLVGAGAKVYQSSHSSAPTDEQRMVSAVQSVKAADADPTWPATPEAVVKDFWKAASKKDYARLTVLCPGSQVSDFKAHYDSMTPGEATAVGAPQQHPTDKTVTLYPVTVPFPHFPKKTIKMAVTKTDAGKYVIDARNTIWW